MKHLLFCPILLLAISCASVPEKKSLASIETCDSTLSEPERQSCLQTRIHTRDYQKYAKEQKSLERWERYSTQKAIDQALGVPERKAGRTHHPHRDKH